MQRHRHGLWLVPLLSTLLVGGGCKDKVPKKEAKASAAGTVHQTDPTSKKSSGSAPVKTVNLPGDLTPAPWLKEAALVTALQIDDAVVIVGAGNGWLRWFSATGEPLGERVGAGAPQVLSTLDVDGDGTQEVIWARGMGRNAADATMVLEVVRISGGEATADPIVLPATTRQQVVGVAAAPGEVDTLWIASFVSKFEVEVAKYQKSAEGWVPLESRGRHRVVSDLRVLDNGTPVIARMYGDTADLPGGIFALPKNKSAEVIPSTRGARALAVLPGDGGQIVMADGWHKNYGKRAQGLVSIAFRKSWGWTKKSSVNVDGAYGFTRLRIGDVNSNEGPEIIASGNGPAVVILPSRPDLVYALGDVVAADAVPVNLSGDARDEVVIAGPKPVIWSPR